MALRTQVATREREIALGAGGRERVVSRPKECAHGVAVTHSSRGPEAGRLVPRTYGTRSRAIDCADVMISLFGCFMHAVPNRQRAASLIRRRPTACQQPPRPPARAAPFLAKPAGRWACSKRSPSREATLCAREGQGAPSRPGVEGPGPLFRTSGRGRREMNTSLGACGA